MSIYPLSVQKKSGRAGSSSGGKDYHLVLIATSDGKALFVTRFGKKDTWGVGFKVEQFNAIHDADAAFNKKLAAKLDKDYSEIIIDTLKECENEAQFRAALGEQYWNKIGPDNLKWLSEDIDTTGVKDVSNYARPVTPPHVHEPIKIETPAERAVDNPNWGLF